MGKIMHMQYTCDFEKVNDPDLLTYIMNTIFSAQQSSLAPRVTLLEMQFNVYENSLASLSSSHSLLYILYICTPRSFINHTKLL